MKVGKKVGRRIFAVLLAAIMALSMAPAAVFGTDVDAAAGGVPQFADMPDNWSTKALQNAVANGLLSGADGRIMPNENLTRAQMAAVITRAFGAQVKGNLSGFTDVKAADWFSDSLSKAFQMGVIKGSGSLMNPNGAITRQETFVILARAFKLQPAEKMDKAFGDADKIANWAKGEVSAFVNAGYIQGSNGKINPTGLITRAEFAQIFDNLLKQYIGIAGEYTGVAAGNIMVNAPGVTLKNLTVSGDLIIGDGVGDGEVTLDSVKVNGRMVVRGGGENSIIIKGSSSVSNVVVARVDGAVSVKVQGDADVEVIYIDDGSDDVSIQGTFGTVEIAAPEIVVKAVGATINNLALEGEGAKFVTDSTSKVTSATLQAPNAQITGTGNVAKVEVQAGANGSKIETPNTQISVGAGVTGVTAGGGTKVDPGTTTNNNSNGTGTTGATAQLPSGGTGGHTDPALTVSNVTVNNASSVTFSSIAAPTAVTWNGAPVPAGNVTYNSTNQIATIAVPKITSISNTLVVSATGYTAATVSVNITHSINNIKLIENTSDLENAVLNQADGQSWLVKNGTYNTQRFNTIQAGGQTGWYFPITANNINIAGESKNGVILTSDIQAADGNWSSQDHISVWGNNVAIENITIKSKIETNKAVEVMGKNFTIRNVDFVQRNDATEQFAGSLYFRPYDKGVDTGDMGNALVENVIINDAWITFNQTYVSSGALTLKNTTIDFRGSEYANSPGFGVISSNSAVAVKVAAGSYFRVLTDNIADLQTQILDRVPAGTTVVLAAGTYYMKQNPIVPSGVTLDKVTNNAAIEVMDANTVFVRNASEFNAALSGTASVIRMASGTYRVDNQIRITKAVTIIGEGNSTIITKGTTAWANATNTKGYASLITIASGANTVRLENLKVTGAKNISMTGPGAGKTDYGTGINVFSSSNVVLKNVTSADNDAAGLIVNGSTVSADTLNTSGNQWGAVNVDQGSGVSTPSTFTITGSGVLKELKQIWADNDNTIGVTAVVTANGYTSYRYKEGPSDIQFLWAKNLKAARIGDLVYPSIQGAINDAAAGTDTVTIEKGTYDLTAALNINKAVTVAGISRDETILKGGVFTSSAHGTTVNLSGGATLKNLTVTRDNSGVWTENYNDSLVSFGQSLSADTTLENCKITRGRNGVYLNNANTQNHIAIIRNNIISDNRTGINFCANCSNMLIENNTITDNWTMGIVYYSNPAGTNLSTIQLINNVIKGNWYGGILLKTAGVTDSPSDQTTGSLKIGNNDFGGTSAGGIQAVTLATQYSASHAEPGYNGQKPAHMTEGTPAGTATAPASWFVHPWTPPDIRIYKQPLAEVTGSGITLVPYTDGDEGTVFISTEAQLKAALTDTAFTNINLDSDISVAEMLTVNRSLTINGAGHVLTVSKDLGEDNSSKHALDIYADNVTVKNLTVDNDSKAYGIQSFEAEKVSLNNVRIQDSKGAGLTVNGAEVTADNLNTSGNSWGGVNVDPGDGVTDPSKFTLTGNGTLAETPQIWSDGAHVSGTATVTVSAIGYQPSYPIGTVTIWTKITPPTEITAASIKGLVAPVAGEKPVTDGALTTSDATYSITSLTWSPVHDPFAGATIYTATIVLTAEDGYKFPAGFIPTVNAGTPAPGTTSGDVSGNTLTFDVTFPATL